MNKEKIASELVKLAKELVARKDVWEQRDRVQKILGTLAERVGKIEIDEWPLRENPDYRKMVFASMTGMEKATEKAAAEILKGLSKMGYSSLSKPI
jgi:hypothetical protein